MLKEPWFWRSESAAAEALRRAASPLAHAYNAVQKRQWARRRPGRAPVPVLCVGAAAMGGAGKTPFAMMIGALIEQQAKTPHFLLRGYGGSLEGPAQVVSDQHSAAEVGDEALLLARRGPTWVAADRMAGARAAAQAGADVVVMDDGFQNPSLAKTVSFLLLDASTPPVRARVFPAGPYREPIAQALTRADFVVTVKETQDAAIDPALRDAIGAMPTASMWLAPRLEGAREKALAFCGIGRPQKFFGALRRGGVALADAVAFPDHHVFSQAELDRLRKRANAAGAVLTTTEKDFCRLPPEARDHITVVKVDARTDNEALIAATLAKAIDNFTAHRDAS